MGGSNGSSGGVKDLSLAEATTMAASQAVSWVAALEVLLVTFSTFKRYRGLYFWSLNISAIGVLIKGVTNLLRFFAVVQPIIIPVIINEPAWVMMVTGQSLVLYSRLHLVVKDERKLRMVLWMIIVNGLILHVPTAVFTCGVSESFVASSMRVRGETKLTRSCRQIFHPWQRTIRLSTRFTNVSRLLASSSKNPSSLFYMSTKQ